MSSKRDYEAAARQIRESPENESAKALAAQLLAQAFERDNPRFDRERFLAACGLT